jgi:hypothetical protein
MSFSHQMLENDMNCDWEIGPEGEHAHRRSTADNANSPGRHALLRVCIAKQEQSNHGTGQLLRGGAANVTNHNQCGQSSAQIMRFLQELCDEQMSNSLRARRDANVI